MEQSLSSRLRNCLLTILELETVLASTELGPYLQKEFVVLKDVLQRLEEVAINEGDVCRIENATSRFLEELKETLEGAEATTVQTSRLLQ